MPDASPAKWHLAHTTWFFETFVLLPYLRGYQVYHPRFHDLFNSYYQSVGSPFTRSRRGLLSRPTSTEIYAYRAHVDRRMNDLLTEPAGDAALRLIELGLHHEQQHQELILTDIKYNLSCNPMKPAWRERVAGNTRKGPAQVTDRKWLGFDSGVHWIGADQEDFSFDNEEPRHRVWLDRFEIASAPVTCGEYLQFVEAGGYHKHEYWLSEGWDLLQQRLPGEQTREEPLYWLPNGAKGQLYTLNGVRPMALDEPVVHLSYFEADAYAKWASARLPTEAEWEVAARALSGAAHDGPFLEDEIDHPVAGASSMLGNVWEWTSSAYLPYPGFQPLRGAIGEYNGKFMCNQFVLRGGSFATPRGHIRASYRNFFPPAARWQFTGLRLARCV